MTMTTIYRHTLTRNGGCCFYRLQADAVKAFNRTEKNGLPSMVEALEVPTGKQGLVSALNLALAHPDSWPGEILKSTKIPATVKLPRKRK